MHRQQDAVFRDADKVKPDGDDLARVHCPDDKHDEIAHACGNSRALHAELGRDEQEVERDVEQRADHGRDERALAALLDHVDAA